MHPFHPSTTVAASAVVALALIAPAGAGSGGTAWLRGPSDRTTAAAAVPNGTVLFHDDFSSCTTAPSTSLWKAERRQWGGVDINGGVAPENVGCAHDATLGKNVLTLTAHGDLFNGTGPVGVQKDGSARGPTDIFKGWAWGQYEPVGRGCAPHCDVRRVGAALETVRLFQDEPVTVEVRMQPCPHPGGLSALWLYNYTEHYCAGTAGAACSQAYRDWCCNGSQCTPATDACKGTWIANQEIDVELPTAPSATKAATANPFFISLQNARFSSFTALPYGNGQCSANPPCSARQYAVLDQAQGDGAYHTYRVQWDPVARTSAFAIDGKTYATLSGKEVVPRAGRLWLGVWFPNAWAGSPQFDTCTARVDHVTVTAGAA